MSIFEINKETITASNSAYLFSFSTQLLACGKMDAAGSSTSIISQPIAS